MIGIILGYMIGIILGIVICLLCFVLGIVVGNLRRLNVVGKALKELDIESEDFTARINEIRRFNYFW